MSGEYRLAGSVPPKPSLLLSADSDTFCRFLLLLCQVKKKWLLENMSNEDEGKWRCTANACAKLFRTSDFLQKHIVAKHGQGLEEAYKGLHLELVKKAFDADQDKPLPPVQVRQPCLSLPSEKEVPGWCVPRRQLNPDPRNSAGGQGWRFAQGDSGGRDPSGRYETQP